MSEPTCYKRKYPDQGEVTREDLQAAFEVAATLVARHGDHYLPLFERLDNELKHRDEKEQARRRAMAIASKVALDF